MWLKACLVVFLAAGVLLSFSVAPALAEQRQGSIVYTRDQLMELRRNGPDGQGHEIPKELRRKYRGCRAGRRRWQRKRRYRPYLPSIVMGNVRSLVNKMDELTALTRSDSVFREGSVLCFTETWLHDNISDSVVSLPGFQLVRGDRSCADSGKKRGGGVAVYVNNKWCNPGHVTVKERVCSPDIELLAVSLRPYYLPREFSHAIVLIVYIPPAADASRASDVITSVTARLQTLHPSAFIAISGDFNHVTLASTLPTFTQFVDCKTRDNNTIDLLYANVKDAYSATALPPLGRADHNIIHLEPRYIPAVQRQPVTTRTVRQWSQEAEETLQGCFEVTNWDVLCDAQGEDIEGLTDCITEYINFCTDIIIPTKTMSCYPNNKPWVTKDIKVTLNRKKAAFRRGDKEELKRVQSELKVKISEGKECYRKKLENKLQQNNMREVWSGLRTITGHGKKDDQTMEGGLQEANQLNLFFNRFDDAASAHPPPSSSHDASPTAQPLSTSSTTPLPPSPSLHHVSPTPPLSPQPFCPPPSLGPSSITISVEDVRGEFSRLRPGKAAGPDGLSPRVLKGCATQLCGIFHHIFTLSLSQMVVPDRWKTSCLVPVPKKKNPNTHSDYRPVALTSHVMKSLERLVLKHLRTVVGPSLDPLQFAYQPRIGVEDAIIYLLHRVYSHLEEAGSTVRVMFFDFSSAFNTIRPALLGNKLLDMQVDAPLVAWITNYLTGRPQYVRLRDSTSDTIVSSTGAPQGTVLSPFLFTLYTSDFRFRSQSCHLQKFSDDSAIVGCISRDQEAEYRSVVDRFVEWCGLNHLQLNVTKTKELVVDFRKQRTCPNPVIINGAEVDIVEDYKYLGVHIDNKLDWSKNTHAVYKKGQSRLYFLRRLRSFNVCRTMLQMFYQSVVASVIFYAVVCWGSRLKTADANRLNKLIRRAGSVLGVQLESVVEVSERRMLKKLLSIMDNTSHPLHATLIDCQSTFSHRLRPPRCTTERHRRSFLPVAIRLYNSSSTSRRDT